MRAGFTVRERGRRIPKVTGSGRVPDIETFERLEAPTPAMDRKQWLAVFLVLLMIGSTLAYAGVSGLF